MEDRRILGCISDMDTFVRCFRISSGAHPGFSSVSTGSVLPGLMQPAREVDQPLQVPRIKMRGDIPRLPSSSWRVCVNELGYSVHFFCDVRDKRPHITMRRGQICDSWCVCYLKFLMLVPLNVCKIALLGCKMMLVMHLTRLNPLTPNDPYSGRTAPPTSKRCSIYIYSTNVGTEYFERGIYSPFSSLQNAVCFIILTHLVPVVLFPFYIQEC